MKRVLGAAAVTLGLLGCDGGPPPGPAVPPPPAWNAELRREAEGHTAHLAHLAALEPRAPGGLDVRLAFGAGADLDLYVTGPDQETVYYANTPSASGGELLEDRRCVHDAQRVETVRFPAPLRPGRYRVGVDYPQACVDAKAPAPFALRIDGPGGVTSHEGLSAYRVFEPVVLELEVVR